MLEEIPTITKLKKYFPHIFATWTCQRCHQLREETFNHVWCCPSNTDLMTSIISDSKQFLITTASAITPSLETAILNDPDQTIWTISEIDTPGSLNFIDLIKGIVPVHLFDLIHSKTKSNKKTLSIINSFFHYLHKRIWGEIWLPRVETMQAAMEVQGISSKDIRYKPSGLSNSQPNRSISHCSLMPSDSWSHFIHDSIHSGLHPFRSYSSRRLSGFYLGNGGLISLTKAVFRIDFYTMYIFLF